MSGWRDFLPFTGLIASRNNTRTPTGNSKAKSTGYGKTTPTGYTHMRPEDIVTEVPHAKPSLPGTNAFKPKQAAPQKVAQQPQRGQGPTAYDKLMQGQNLNLRGGPVTAYDKLMAGEQPGQAAATKDPGNVANFGVQMPWRQPYSVHNAYQGIAQNLAARAGQNQNTLNPAEQATRAWDEQMQRDQVASQRNSDRAAKERMMDKMLAAFAGNRPPAPVPVGSSGQFNAPQLSSLPVAVQNIRGPGAQLTGDPIADKRNIALANARNRAAQAYRRKTIGEDISTHDQANAAAAAQQQTRDLLAAVGDRRLALGQEANDNSTLMRLMGLLS